MGSVCPQRTLADLMQRLYPEAQRVPSSMSLELTRRCNFACTHCYCRLPAAGPTPRPELTTAQWERILRQSVDEGVLFALFTGGEPLLRPDFRELWRLGRKLGLLPTLFTNGLLVDAEVADFLAEWTPRQVSISLYGASEETYRLVTGREGAHRRVLQSVELLRERGVIVEVRSIITRMNLHEVPALREQSARYQDLFKWDAELIGPYPESLGQPESVRLTAQELFDLEAGDGTRMAEWRELAQRWTPAPPTPDNPFRCGVARNEFHVNAYGEMHPCLGLEAVSLDLLQRSVHEAWEALPAAIEALLGPPGPCQQCGLPPICRQCPADALLEGERPGWPLPERCEMARLRAQALGLPPPPAWDVSQPQLSIDSPPAPNL